MNRIDLRRRKSMPTINGMNKFTEWIPSLHLGCAIMTTNLSRLSLPIALIFIHIFSELQMIETHLWNIKMRFEYTFDCDKKTHIIKYVVYFWWTSRWKVHFIGVVAVAAVVVGVLIASVLSSYRHRLQYETLVNVILSVPPKFFKKATRKTPYFQNVLDEKQEAICFRSTCFSSSFYCSRLLIRRRSGICIDCRRRTHWKKTYIKIELMFASVILYTRKEKNEMEEYEWTTTRKELK